MKTVENILLKFGAYDKSLELELLRHFEKLRNEIINKDKKSECDGCGRKFADLDGDKHRVVLCTDCCDLVEG